MAHMEPELLGERRNKPFPTGQHQASAHSRKQSRDSLALKTSVSNQTTHEQSHLAVRDPFNYTTLGPSQPQQLQTPVTALTGKVYRQILGLNPFKSSYFAIYRSLDSKKDKFVACAGAFCAILAGVPLPIIAAIFGTLINTFPPSEHEVETRIARLLGVALAYFIVTALYTTAFGITSEKISINLRQELVDCLLNLDQAFIDTHDIDFDSFLTDKIDVINNGCSEKAGIFIQSISYFVAAFIVGFILSPKLTGILIAAVIPTMISIVVITSIQGSRLSKQVAKHNEQANGIVQSTLQAIRVVQAFDMMAALCERHLGHLQQGMTASVRKAVVSAVQVGAIFFTAYAINGLAFYVGSRMAASTPDSGDAGTVFAVVLLILDSSFVVAQFAPFIDIFARAAAAREAIQDLFDARAASVKPLGSHSDNEKPSIGNFSLSFEDVSFAYPARPTRKALDKLNLTVQPGTFTAIVGSSGGGKSTLFSLLSGMYDYTGNIRFGPHELRSLDISNVRKQISLVDQDPVMFSGSIYDNVCDSVVQEGDEDDNLLSRCKVACEEAALDFLDDLPHGIDTYISNDLQLSGGQRQRICLARALIRKPAVILLDEPTSALDARSEVLVMDAVKKAARSGTTVIMVAHRLSTVLDADHIAVVRDGKVVEQGSPQELSEQGTVFRGLLEAQNTHLSKNDQLETRRESVGKDDVSDSDNNTLEWEAANSRKEVSSETTLTAIGCRDAVSQLWPIFKPDSPLVLGGLLASMISGGLLLGEAIIFGNLVQLLNRGTKEGQFQERADFFCLMFFVLACIALVAWICSGSAFGIATNRSIVRLRIKLLSHILNLDMEWFVQEGHAVHDLMNAFTKDTGDLSSLSGPALGTIFTTSTSVVGGIILAHVVAWKIAAVLLSAVPVMLLAGFLRLRLLAKADSRRRIVYRQATSLAAEACDNKRTVTVFGLEDRILQRYRKALQIPYEKGRCFVAWSNLLLAFSFAVTYFVYALAYWWGSRLVRNGDYSEKQFFTVLPALLFSAQSAGQLFSLSPEIARAKAAALSTLRLLQSSPGILIDRRASDSSSISAKLVPASEKTNESIPKIEFDNVCISYPERPDKAVLKNLSFTISRGMTIALVGPSGAGKSTAVALMARFYDASTGYVKLDGSDTRELDVRQLRSCIGLVPQEPDLLPGSISYNIRLGSMSGQVVSDADIENVCRRCGLHDFISSLPEAYSTEVGTGNAPKLSGGQQQRLALARALIREPEILLLDEFSSALDAHSERQVHDAIAEAAQGRTTVIVAHRLASIRHVDEIFVFDQGTVVERGTHAHLVARGGLYASMAKAQSIV